MRTQRSLTALIKEPSVSGVMVTNTSGSPFAVSVWDIAMYATISPTAAGAYSSDVSIQIDGVIVCQYNILVQNAGNTSSGTFHHNAGGQQFILANGHTITLNQTVTAGVFTRVGASMAVDFVLGS